MILGTTRRWRERLTEWEQVLSGGSLELALRRLAVLWGALLAFDYASSVLGSLMNRMSMLVDLLRWLKD